MIKSITLTNYRNIEDTTIEFDPKSTLIIGNNAQGKTNILEAIFTLATTKPFRGASSYEAIRYDHDYARITGITKKNSLEVLYSLIPKKGTQVQINEMKVPIAQFLGNFPAVLFSPDDLLLIGGEPRRRRRFLDMILSQVVKGYLPQFLLYQKTLKHRNALLKQIAEKKASKSDLFFWDQELAKKVLPIVEARSNLFEFLCERTPIIWEKITSKGHLSFLTKGNTSSLRKEDTSKFLTLLEKRHDRDIILGTTSVGPHRDDFSFEIDKTPLESFGSRGEWRSAIFTLKMVELLFIEEHLKQKPLLLLDDIFSELDEERTKTILPLLEKHQTILTTTSLMNEIESKTVMEVIKGKVHNKKELSK